MEHETDKQISGKRFETECEFEKDLRRAVRDWTTETDDNGLGESRVAQTFVVLRGGKYLERLVRAERWVRDVEEKGGFVIEISIG